MLVTSTQDASPAPRGVGNVTGHLPERTAYIDDVCVQVDADHDIVGWDDLVRTLAPRTTLGSEVRSSWGLELLRPSTLSRFHLARA